MSTKTKPKTKPKRKFAFPTEHPKIEKGIPMPYRVTRSDATRSEQRDRQKKTFASFLRRLEIDDSFTVESPENDRLAQMYITSNGNAVGIRLISMRISEKEIRFWRAE